MVSQLASSGSSSGIGRNINTHTFQNIAKRQRRTHKKTVPAELNKVLLDNILLVPYLTNQFLKEIFDGNDSANEIILVAHDTKVDLVLPHCIEQVVDIVGAFYKMRLKKYRTDIDLFVAYVCAKEFPYRQNSDNIVKCSVAYKNAGVRN